MARDILGTNAYLAAVLARLRDRIASLKDGQNKGKYLGITGTNKPRYSYDGKTLTGNFTFNTGQRKGSIVIGDTQEFVAAQAVQEELYQDVEEAIDPEFYTDFFLISRPDGSSGYVRTRIPRMDSEGEAIDGLPIIDLVVISYPYTQGGNAVPAALNTDVEASMMTKSYLEGYISGYVNIPVRYQYRTPAGNQTINLDSVGVSTSPNNNEIHYCVDPKSTAVYLGAGATDPSGRNGYKAIRGSFGTSVGFEAHLDVNSYQYNFQEGFYKNLFKSNENETLNMQPQAEKIVNGGDAFYSSYFVERETGKHEVELKFSQSIHSYNKMEFSGFLAGRRLLTTVAAQSTSPGNVTANGFSSGAGNGMWDIPVTYQTYCDGNSYTRNGWQLPDGFTIPQASENYIIGANANYNVQGFQGVEFQALYDRSATTANWNDTGIYFTSGQGNVNIYGANTTFPGCYAGSFYNYQVGSFSCTNGTSGSSDQLTLGQDNFQCSVTTSFSGYTCTDNGHQTGAINGYNAHLNIEDVSDGDYASQYNSCGQPVLTDRLHTDPFIGQLGAFRFHAYDKNFYRNVFSSREIENRELVPSYFGTAYCEIIHPVEYLSPLGFQSVVHPHTTSSYTQVDFTMPQVTATGYIERYHPTTGIVGNEYIVTDHPAQMMSDYSTIETGYNLEVSLPPLILVNQYIADQKFETYAFAYEEGYQYFYPKVSVKLHGQELWLGGPLNSGFRKDYYQRVDASYAYVDAYGNSLNVNAPEPLSDYPLVWTGWSEPAPTGVWGSRDEIIYSVKETDPYYNLKDSDDETDVLYCEWTTVNVIRDDNGDIEDYKVKFWYGTIETFLTDPMGSTTAYQELNGSVSDILYNRTVELFLLKTWEFKKPYLVNLYIDDVGLNYEDITAHMIEGLESLGNPSKLLGNIGLRVTYSIWTDSIYSMGFENSPKKQRPGGLALGITAANKFVLAFNDPDGGIFGGNGSGFLRYEKPIDQYMGAHQTKMSEYDIATGITSFLNTRYCLTGVQEKDRGWVSLLFNSESAITTAGGGVIHIKDDNGFISGNRV
jgi:hypothetical protein